jgi:hypothetical protein
VSKIVSIIQTIHKVVIPLIYDRAFAFSNGVAMVYKDGKMLKINKYGEVIEDANN